jgi:hypothetical protein
MSNVTDGIHGWYEESATELCFQNFIESLMAMAIAVAKSQE